MRISKIIIHPLTQVFSFSMILVTGPYFGGPYIFFIYNALLDGYNFAIIGGAAIVSTLSCMIVNRSARKNSMRLIGVVLMFASLFVFFLPSKGYLLIYTFSQAVPLTTFLLFILIITFAIRRSI